MDKLAEVGSYENQLEQRELQILREAALISMSKKAEQAEALELAALREAALDSARERKLSSDLLRKRRLESPPSHHHITLPLPSRPSHHYNTRLSGEYESYESDEGNTTPKMSECDSAQHTPPPRENSTVTTNTIFTVKVTDNMLLKRSSSNHDNGDDLIPYIPIILPRKDENKKITIKLTTEKLPEKEEEEEEDVREEVEEEVEEEEEEVVLVEDTKGKSDQEPSPLKPLIVEDMIKSGSPVFSKVSSADDLPQPKKQKKKHKKKKSSKNKRQKHNSSLDSVEDKPLPKEQSSQHKHQKKHNGVSSKEHKPKLPEQIPVKPEKNHKKHTLSELDKIDRNIEMLQKAKKQKHEHKSWKAVATKIISEEVISSDEEEALLKEKDKKPSKSDKRRSLSPRNSDHKKEKRSKDSGTSKARSRSASPVPDLSVSLKSKREFEQMKAELNKYVPKHSKKGEKSHRSPRKEDRSKSPKKEDRRPKEESNKVPADTGAEEKDSKEEIPTISELEELLLLGDDIKIIEEKKHGEDCVMKEDSLSDSEEDNDQVNIISDKKSETKRKKTKKAKKKKNKEDKKKKKKRKKHNSSGSSTEDEANKKPKVKIDKSELNKIVQFLKQRDEAQRTDGPNAPKNSGSGFNPKIISKEAKPIEIKIKSKPKR